MESIASNELKTRLGRKPREVQNGKEYIVTTHGKPVAKLVPYNKDKEIGGANDRMRNRQKKNNLNGITVKALINEGRRNG